MKDYVAYRRDLNGLIRGLGQQAPATLAGFEALREAGLADGVLGSKTKELIALGIAIGVHCDGCIAYHVHDALRAGATTEEVIETIGVAIVMGGGPGLIYAAEAFEALQQFQAPAGGTQG